MTNSPSYSEPLMLLKCASYLNSHLPGEGYSQAESQNPASRIASPSSTEITKMCLNNAEKGNFPHHGPGTMQ